MCFFFDPGFLCVCLLGLVGFVVLLLTAWFFFIVVVLGVLC